MDGMFAPMIMPLAAYEELHTKFVILLPLPKPQSAAGINDLHYMSFEEVVTHPFPDKHQPSLQNRRQSENLNVVADVPIGDRETRGSNGESEKSMSTQGKFIRRLVPCKDCMKPRCLYSANSPSRMKPHVIDGETEPTTKAIRLCRQYAMQKFEEAQVSDVYVCGMQPFDADDLMYGVIVAREGLECHHHMEF